MTSVDAAVPANSARAAVLVLGMHRSGTSAFARVASLLGCALPDHVMQAAEGNGLGFWESNAVVTLNDQLLASAGSRWDDWLPLNEGWAQSTVHAEFLDRAREVLREEYGKSPLFVLKDPRICRLAPFWINAIESLGIRPLIALPQRNPYEVADSLAERDGSDRGLGLLLWLRHTLEAEAATRELPRFFFSYDQLLTDWTKVAEGFERATDMRFPGRSVLAEEEISRFLSQDARHHREPETVALSGTAPSWLSETYAIMRRWSEGNGTADDVARLDAIRSELDGAAPSISRIIRDGIGAGDGVGSAGRARRELRELTVELESLRSELADATRDRDERTSQQAESELRYQEQAASAAAAQSELERLRNDLNEADRAGDVLRKQLEAGLEDAKRVSNDLVEAGSALRQRQEEATQAWAEANTERQLRERAEAELLRAVGQNERLIDKFSEVEANIRADAGALAAARAQASEAAQVIASLQREHATRDADIERLRAQKDRADSELVQLTLLLAETQARARELEAAIQSQSQPAPQPEVEQEDANLNGSSPIAELQNKQVEWLRDVTALLRNFPAWWVLLPDSKRKKHEGALLRAQGLFDPAAYLECHPDVAQEGMDPFQHYLHHGIFEGRKW